MITPDLVRKAIENELARHIAEITKDESEKAASEVRRRVAALTGQIATTVAQHFSYERHGSDITISVRFP